MISHEYKCIFIHIPRTAGTSIEKWIANCDWWHRDERTKHLLASQSKKIYSDYWDEYFKFSFVRNPWDRMVSMSKYGSHYGVYISKDKKIDISRYIKEYGDPITIEHDYRFSKRKDIATDSHRPHTIYGNILDEELDFVGRFENLNDDVLFLNSQLNIDAEFKFKEEELEDRLSYKNYYNNNSRQLVEDLYKKDIEEFNYQF
jgi:hypothetical protein